jgi:hypothetical protein
MPTKSCSTCGARFECGAGTGSCWCGTLPAIMPLDVAQECLCPPCLKAALRERIARFVATVTPASAPAAAAQLPAPDGTLVEGIDYELEPGGLLVFSKWYLLRRGFCCESGCRNCPWGFAAR